LSHKGYSVTTAISGKKAIELVTENSFDIIFMDIKMPIMNGVETYKRIKKINPKTIVIMMTAYAVEELVDEALQEGAYGVIYKPLDIENVSTLIEKVRNKRQGALILVVDDNLGICNTIKNILIKKGYNVDIAQSGEEAILMAKELKYNLIFIDMKLPIINGLETYLSIKEINPEVVAIMMTGYRQEMNDLVKQALENNAYICLEKPLDMDEVLQLISEIEKKK
jgi:DNA-binding NtrC family response regulator